MSEKKSVITTSSEEEQFLHLKQALKFCVFTVQMLHIALTQLPDSWLLYAS